MNNVQSVIMRQGWIDMRKELHGREVRILRDSELSDSRIVMTPKWTMERPLHLVRC